MGFVAEASSRQESSLQAGGVYCQLSISHQQSGPDPPELPETVESARILSPECGLGPASQPFSPLRMPAARSQGGLRSEDGHQDLFVAVTVTETPGRVHSA